MTARDAQESLFDARLQEIRERVAATIPAPWYRIGFQVTKPEVDIVDWAYADLPPAGWPDAEESAGRVLDFIAYSREDIPWLLEQIERLTDASLVMHDAETWEPYARRLERRIKEQRDHLESLQRLGKDQINRADRKKIERLKRALGHVTENWHREREARIALVKTVAEMRRTADEAA